MIVSVFARFARTPSKVTIVYKDFEHGVRSQRMDLWSHLPWWNEIWYFIFYSAMSLFSWCIDRITGLLASTLIYQAYYISIAGECNNWTKYMIKKAFTKFIIWCSDTDDYKHTVLNLCIHYKHCNNMRVTCEYYQRNYQYDRG